MPISVVFDPPLPSDSPSTFNTKAFTLLGDLNDWSTQANALPGEVATNLTTLLAAPPAIGSTTPAAGNFTTLSAGSTTTGAHTINTGSTANVSTTYTNAGSTRWTAYLGGAGLDYRLSNYNDSGVQVGDALTISRSTGAVTIPGSVSVGSLSASGQLTSTTDGNGKVVLATTGDVSAAGYNYIHFKHNTSTASGYVGYGGVAGKFTIANALASGTFSITTGGYTDRFTIDSAGAVTIPGGITQESVIAPTPLNSWVDFGAGYPTMGYWKDTFGVVHLTGIIKSGTLGSAAFVLPIGYRPATQLRFSTVSNDLFGWGYLAANGDVVPQSGSNINFSLDGITFRAGS